jgi:hypothetical protein
LRNSGISGNSFVIPVMVRVSAFAQAIVGVDI